MGEWRLCVCVCVCVSVGLIGGFQTQEHSSGTEDPMLTLLRFSAARALNPPTHTRAHTNVHRIFVAQSV